MTAHVRCCKEKGCEPKTHTQWWKPQRSPWNGRKRVTPDKSTMCRRQLIKQARVSEGWNTLLIFDNYFWQQKPRRRLYLLGIKEIRVPVEIGWSFHLLGLLDDEGQTPVFIILIVSLSGLQEAPNFSVLTALDVIDDLHSFEKPNWFINIDEVFF